MLKDIKNVELNEMELEQVSGGKKFIHQKGIGMNIIEIFMRLFK